MKHFVGYALRPGTGRTVPQASIRVKQHPSNDASPEAAIFSDYDGESAIVQPFLTDAQGVIQFYAPDGRYDIYMSIPDPVYGTISGKWSDVFIYDNAVSSGAAAVVDNSAFVTYRKEGLLSNEIAIPTFQGHPDIVPGVPSAFDNEFEQSTVDWALYNDGFAGQVFTLANSRVTLGAMTDTVTNPAFGYYRTSFTPSADFILWSLIRLGYNPGTSGAEMSGERPMFSLGLRTGLGEITAIGLRGGAQGISVFVSDYSSVGLVGAEEQHQIGSNSCYVRIRRASGILYYEWSQDGFEWITAKVAAEADVLNNPIVQFGLFLYASFDTGGFVRGTSDFVRYKAV